MPAAFCFGGHATKRVVSTARGLRSVSAASTPIILPNHLYRASNRNGLGLSIQNIHLNHPSRPLFQNSLPEHSSRWSGGSTSQRQRQISGKVSRVTTVTEASSLHLFVCDPSEPLSAKHENDPVLDELLGWVKVGLKPDYTAMASISASFSDSQCFQFFNPGQNFRGMHCTICAWL